MIMNMRLLQGDCLELMKDIPNDSINMILCDLPYGSTKNKWDFILDLDKLWIEYTRIIKDKGAIVLFSQFPFDKILAVSNIKMFKYEWIWVKSNATGFLNSHNAPLKTHENILVFSKSPACFVKEGCSTMMYNPQFTLGKPYTTKQGDKGSSNYGKQGGRITVSDGKRYPKDVLYFNSDLKKFHPTQKPVRLCEYLIKTYTNEGDVILDNCMGSGTTGVACKNLGRSFIGMELDKEYFRIAEERINSVCQEGLKSFPLFLE